MTNVMELRTYIKCGFNILLQGKHGTGKTTMLMKACEAEGLKLQVYNTASMDPFTDLVGVPKFTQDEDGNDVLVSVRPRAIDDANVILFDELNRADPRITNAVFELIQFGTINGEKLPNLKCVIAAQNPPTEDYDVQPLDPALIDRFHITLDVEPSVSVSYLATRFDRPVAAALSTWYHDRSQKRTDYISPRRLEMIGNVFVKTKSKTALKAAFPPGGTFEVGKLFDLLVEATMTDAERKKAQEERDAKMNRLAGRRSGGSTKTTTSPASLLTHSQLSQIKRGDVKKIRRIAPNLLVNALDRNHTQGQTLQGPERAHIVSAISSQISPAKMATKEWMPVYGSLTAKEARAMFTSWSGAKQSQFRKAYYSMGSAERLGFNEFVNLV